MRTKKILVTGAGGQLGQELVEVIISKFGRDVVIASDINPRASEFFKNCEFEVLDVLQSKNIEEIIRSKNITEIYHLAAILSANGEANPINTWDINMSSLLNVLNLAKDYSLKIFWPSSIAVFGKDSPLENTPQTGSGIPGTVYGISKQAGEHWCHYYHQRYGVDVRSVRFPGLIGYKTIPGGGTTDYAVDIYHKAISGKDFSCFLAADTRLPMMYMPDAIKATLQLMEVPSEKLSVRTSYSISGFSFSPAEIYKSILNNFPHFKINYQPDHREHIARSWPRSIDDSIAKKDWNWKPEFDLQLMTNDIIKHLSLQYSNSKCNEQDQFC